MFVSCIPHVLVFASQFPIPSLLKKIITDDLIATRRRANPSRTAKKNNAAARATGQNKARRGAKVAARRGIPGSTNNNSKPTPMEEERQVNRVKRGTGALRNGRGGRGAGAAGGGARSTVRSGRGVRGTAPRVSDVKAKAKARLSKARSVIAQQKAGKNGGVAAPTQKAVSAAAKAMKDFGFKAPKGMQMQISFVPKKGAATGGGGGGNKGGRSGGRGGNNNNNAGGRANNSGGRGGRGRGRR